MSKENTIAAFDTDESQIAETLGKAADRNGTVTASRLRKVNRKVYEDLMKMEGGWRAAAQERGFLFPSTRRGRWNDRNELISVAQTVALQVGRAPTRQDLINAGYGSALVYIGKHFDGIDGLREAAGIATTKDTRQNGWHNDPQALHDELVKHTDGGHRLPSALRMRALDSSLEAFVRYHYGSWESGANALGFEVVGARKKWSCDEIERLYLDVVRRHGRTSMRDLTRILSPGFVRAVQRRYGSLRSLQEKLGIESRELIAPQGFSVSSTAELRVAVALHHLGIPVTRDCLVFSDGTRREPDFLIQFGEQHNVAVEVLMTDEGTAKGDVESEYARNWQRRKRTYEENGFPYITITPSDLQDPESLITRLANLEPESVPVTAVGLAQGSWDRYTAPQWTREKVRDEVMAYAANNGGYMPSQSQLHADGRADLVKAIHTWCGGFGPLQRRLGLMPAPIHEKQYRSRDQMLDDLLAKGRELGRRPKALELRQVHYLALLHEFGGLEAAWTALEQSHDRAVDTDDAD